MPVTITATFARMALDLSAQSMGELAPALDITLGQSTAPVRGLKVAADTMDALLDAIEGIAARMDDPDRIAAVRVDEDACCAELDVDARPVDPRGLQ